MAEVFLVESDISLKMSNSAHGKKMIDFSNTKNGFERRTTFELFRALLVFVFMRSPIIGKFALSSARMALRLGLPVESILYDLVFSNFCGKRDLAQSVPIIEKLAKYKM